MSVISSPPRLFVPDGLTLGTEILLSLGQARYLTGVMRRKPEDPVILFNGRDGEWRGHLVMFGKKSVKVCLSNQMRFQASDPALRLMFALVKRSSIDFTVQKATELGVSLLQPVLTARTNSARVNTDRLTAIAVEAAEQSGRISVPDILAPVPLADALRNWPKERILFVLDETGSGARIAPTFEGLSSQAMDGGAFVIGPEGGFTNAELDLLRALPFCRLISLGPRILRAETAALAVLTCWQALCGDWRFNSDANHFTKTN